MKLNNNYIRLFLSVFLFALTLQSCFTTNYGKIVSEHDEVKSTDRFKLIFFYDDDKERYTSFINAKQTILKEINSDKISTYTIFEEISLNSEAFKLKEDMYILVDSEVFPIRINNTFTERFITVSEDTDSVLTSDSTNVDVVTGYSTNERKRIKHYYTLNASEIKAIKNAEKLSFRYYSGPHKMTISMDHFDLKKFKQLINMPKEDKL